MFLNFWRQLVRSNFSPRIRRPSRKPRHSRALNLEQLEDRLVPVVGAAVIPGPVPVGTGFDGVAQLTTQNGGICTGSLLYTARHVLTAAHCVDADVDTDGDGRADQGNGTVDAGAVTLTFTLPGRTVTFSNIPSASISISAAWNGIVRSGNDLAVIALPEIGPFGAERYNLYRNNNEIGQNFTMVGYGRTGIGATGNQAGTSGTKRAGQNRWEADANLLGGAPMNIAPVMSVGIGLAYDFDNGSVANDAFGAAYNINNTGLGLAEACQSKGDSGGPAFIGNLISGVVSFSRLRYGSPPDVDGARNNSFGEFAVMTRVSAFAGVIDTMVGGRYDLVMDLANQTAGNDGAADTIKVRKSGDNLELLINSQVVHSDLLSNITSVTLRGSKDQDIFMVEESLGKRVTVDGRGGSDTLDYSAYTGAVTVNLETGSATGVTGGVLSIENVTGGWGDDLLRGNASDNILKGGGGNDILVGAAGSDTLNGDGVAFAFGRDLLIGGLGVDNLNGGAGDDILIGGTTVHDANNSSLRLLLSEWTGNNSYALRVDHLSARAPGGLNGGSCLYDGLTVFDDGAADVLTGSLGADWFLGQESEIKDQDVQFLGERRN